MKLTKNQIIVIGVVILIIVGLILIFIIGKKESRPTGSAVTLNFWGIDDEDAFKDAISQYQSKNPNTQINYRRFDPVCYEFDLINGLAASTGPDIFMFHNTWLPKHYDKAVPLTETEFPLRTFKEFYPTVVEQDFAPDGVIYAVPLYIDTLALFYNKNIFDTKGIVFPPKTWTELEKTIPQLKEVDKQGRIVKAAVALGGSSKSIHQANNILNLIMLQNNVSMVSKDFSEATFAEQGLKSLNYYVGFANPANPLYSWDEKFGYSLDAFSEEKAAMIFDYSDGISFLKEKNPFLAFETSPMLQTEGATKEINYANYWGLTVSNKSKHSDVAWDFITDLTTQSESSKKYLEVTYRPPALRALIQKSLNDPTLGIFAKQALTARSWPQIDNNEVEKSFSKMIESVLSGVSAESAISQAEEEITQLMARRAR